MTDYCCIRGDAIHYGVGWRRSFVVTDERERWWVCWESKDALIEYELTLVPTVQKLLERGDKLGFEPETVVLAISNTKRSELPYLLALKP